LRLLFLAAAFCASADMESQLSFNSLEN